MYISKKSFMAGLLKGAGVVLIPCEWINEIRLDDVRDRVWRSVSEGNLCKWALPEWSRGGGVGVSWCFICVSCFI